MTRLLDLPSGSVQTLLERLRKAGLGTLQGTAAEILVDEVRRVICPRKCDTATWLRVIREAHAMGIRSTATIMYGAGETTAHRARHLSLDLDAHLGRALAVHAQRLGNALAHRGDVGRMDGGDTGACR